MKIEARKDVTVTLTLDRFEANWLLHLVGQLVNDRGSPRKEFYSSLFGELHEQLGEIGETDDNTARVVGPLGADKVQAL